MLGGSCFQEDLGCPQGEAERQGRGEKGPQKQPMKSQFPYCFICSWVLPWALMFSNLDQRDLKSCRKG